MGQPMAAAKTVLAGFDRHYGLFRYNAQQERIRQGILDDVYPYAESFRFSHYES